MPTVRNGAPIRTRYHRVWDRFVRALTGGLTVLRPAKGIWVSPTNETIEERMIPVRVACTRAELEKIIDFSLTYYDQDAIMAYEISNNVIIKYRNDEL